MANTVKKRGQKFLRRFSRATTKASEGSKEHIKENLFGRISHIENIKLLILEWALLAVALIMLAATQAFWFGDSYAENVFSRGGTYTEATIGSVNSLNPLFAVTSSEKTLSRLMFSTIVTVDPSGHLGMGLAKSLVPTEGGKIWTVYLRDGLKWSDGEPITTEDVLFTAKLIKNPAVSSIYDTNLSGVKVSEDEKGGIRFELPTAYADFISALNFPVLPKHKLDTVDPKVLIESDFSNAPITSGPFSFNAIQPGNTSDEKIYYLSANPNYYKSLAMLSSFAVHTYPDKSKIVDAVNSGVITATAELSGSEQNEIVSPQFTFKNSELNSGAFLFFNISSPVMKSLDLRNAIRQGLDMDNIRSVASDTEPLDYPILSSQIPLSYYKPLPESNKESAKTKIAELKGEEELNVSIATVNSGYLPGVADAISRELNDLGIKTNITYYEENQEFISNVIARRDYDILVYEIELGATPDLLPYYHSSQASAAGLNLSNYHNALADDLLLGARDTLDETLRIKKYEAFLEHWVTDVPAIGLYKPNLTYYYNKNVRTFSNDIKLVTALDRFSDVTIWAVNKVTKNKTP